MEILKTKQPKKKVVNMTKPKRYRANILLIPLPIQDHNLVLTSVFGVALPMSVSIYYLRILVANIVGSYSKRLGYCSAALGQYFKSIVCLL